jgi:hypothetical protein
MGMQTSHRNLIQNVAATLLPVALAVAGCGADPARFSSGVDTTRSLGALDATEAASLCTDARSFTAAQTRLTDEQICTFSGLFAVGFRLFGPPIGSDDEARTKCTASHDACLASIAAKKQSGTPVCYDHPCAAASPTCARTVADVESCVSAMPAYWRNVFLELPSCGEVTAVWANSYPPQFPQPAACASLHETCPEMQPEDDYGYPLPICP